MNLHTQRFLGMSKKWELKKSFNAVFPFNVKKATMCSTVAVDIYHVTEIMKISFTSLL